MFKATVLIKRRPSILDPQGVAVEKGAKHLGINNIKSTRIGKLIEFDVDLTDRSEAEKEVKNLLFEMNAPDYKKQHPRERSLRDPVRILTRFTSLVGTALFFIAFF